MNQPDPKPLRVFVSYTAEDLARHADVALEAIAEIEWVGIDHRKWPASGRPSVSECRRRVRRCDVLIVLVAHRYGWIPAAAAAADEDEDEGGDGERSITWLEVQAARDADLPVIPFLVEDDASWPVGQIEFIDQPQVRAPLTRFKDELRDGIAGFFGADPTSLKQPVTRALHQLDVERRSAGAAPRPAPSDPAPVADPFADYRDWLRQRHAAIELKGVGSGDIRLPIGEVFVPLRIGYRLGADDDGQADDADAIAAVVERALFIEDVFDGDTANRHALLFGEPGTGKTTALRKLLLQCVDDPAKIARLEPDMQPVLLPLRRLRQLGTERALAEIITEVVTSEARRDQVDLGADIGDRLWQHGKLLLLLDGYDEVADEQLYVATAAWLRRELGRDGASQLRVVITCREVLRQVVLEQDLGADFTVFDFEKLDSDGCKQLVRRWFGAASRQLPSFPMPEADATAQRLIDALDSPDYASQQLKVLVSTPLLLTLLCVVALREGEMPRHRVTFYQRCLEVLLNKWRYSQHAEKPLLELHDALAVLRAVAYALHRDERREASELEFAKLVATPRRSLGLGVGPQKILQWLRRETGVLVEVADDEFGFMHLGLQEYLCAEELALRGEGEALAANASDPWWGEVTLLHVGLRDRAAFGPWCRALLARPDWRQDQPQQLLADALRDAHQPDLAPLLELLPADDAATTAAVLRLLTNRSEADVVAKARELVRDDDTMVRAAAQHIVDRDAARHQVGQPCDVLVVAEPGCDAMARDCLRALRGAGAVPRWDGEQAGGKPWWRDLDAVLDCKAVLVLAAGGSEPWRDQRVLDGLDVLRKEGAAIALVAGDAVAVPGPAELLAESLTFGGNDWQRITSWLESLAGDEPGATAATSAREGQHWREPITGIRFLWIEGGEFDMGSREYEHEQPVHRVRVPGFWLAETPVTNAQFGVYLEHTGAAEPEFWRQKKWSGPQQPVVGVSWHDAVAFCRWLGEQSGGAIELPSEARWEFAARAGTKTRFSFGDRDGDLEDYGWFKQNSGRRTHDVATKQPNPWGLYDMHGNVREWCLDEWHGNYDGAPTDGGAWLDGDGYRVVRGGSWFTSGPGSVALPTASWRPPDFRYAGIGFRPARVVTK